MSDFTSSAPVYTIEVGTPGHFTNDASTDISVTVNAEMRAAPAGDQIKVIFNPGDYAETGPLLLQSNTSVVGNDATLGFLCVPGHENPNGTALIANAAAYDINNAEYVENSSGQTSYVPYSPTNSDTVPQSSSADPVINTNISVCGMTFNETGNITAGSTFSTAFTNTFGTWFINAQNVSIENNTYIGGNDGNAFVNVSNGVVASNIAVGQLAAFDNWDGPTNITVEDNSVWQDSAGEISAAASVQINSTPTGDNANSGNAVNDAILDNTFTGNSNEQSAINADPLLGYGQTAEQNITEQGNIDTLLGSVNAQGYYTAGPMSNTEIEDNLITGAIEPTTKTPGLFQAVGSELSNAQMSGNLVFDATTETASTEQFLDWGASPTAVNNAVLDQSQTDSSAFSIAGTSEGNIENSGTSVIGSGVTEEFGVTAPTDLVAGAGTSISISGLSMTDSNSTEVLHVTLTTQFGTISGDSSSSGISYTKVNGEAAVVLVGNVTTVNSDLQSLTYTSNQAGWDDSIELSASSASGEASSRYTPVLVNDGATQLSNVTTIASGFISPTAIDNELFPGQTLGSVPTLAGQIVLASSGDNLISMSSLVSIAFLGSGQNTLQGGTGDEYLSTGTGAATVNLNEGGSVSVVGGGGAITINAATGNDLIEPGSSDSTITGGDGALSVVGGLGNLNFQGGTGSLYLATLPQDNGDVTANLGTGDSTIFALSGDDTISTQYGSSNSIHLGIGDDSVVSDANDVIYCGAGNDTIDLQTESSATVFGGSGTLTFADGTETSPASAANGKEYVFDQDYSSEQLPTGTISLVGGGTISFNDSTSSAQFSSTPNGDSIQVDGSANIAGLGEDATILGGNDILNVNNSASTNDTSIITHNSTANLILGSGSNSVLSGAGNVSVDASLAKFLNIELGAGGGKVIASTAGFSQISTTADADDTINVNFNQSGKSQIASYGNDDIYVGGAASVSAMVGSSDNITVSGGSLSCTVGAGAQYGTTSANLTMSDGYATISAEGMSRVELSFMRSGELDFINSSILQQCIGQGSDGSITVSGGAGGGVYYGGLAGENSLIGGSGSVTLTGGGTGDILEANSNSGANDLISGAGAETMIGSSMSGSNSFTLSSGSDDVVSSAGSGQQTFLLQGAILAGSTITGSQASGAFNTYDISEDTIGGGSFTIKNFIPAQSAIYFTGGMDASNSLSIASIEQSAVGAPLSSTILFSNQSSVTLIGISANSLHSFTTNNGVMGIN